MDTFESFTSMDDDGAAAAAHRPVQEDAVSAHRPSPIAQQSSSSSSEEEEPFSDAPSPVRAVLNRPWPSPVLIPSPSGKVRTLVATSDTIGPPITPEELDALEDKEGDDMCTLHYKAAGRAGATIRNYVHQHGSLYLDENGGFMIDHSPLMEEIRCKNVPVEEMEERVFNFEVTKEQTYLSELALASYNKRRKVKFELCKMLLSRSFWEDRGYFVHLNFIAKRKDKKKLFFAEIEDCGKRDGETYVVRCSVSLESACEGGYYNMLVPTPPQSRKGLDFSKCYACTQSLKHPPSDGSGYLGGHDHQKRTYLFERVFN